MINFSKIEVYREKIGSEILPPDTAVVVFWVADDEFDFIDYAHRLFGDDINEVPDSKLIEIAKKARRQQLKMERNPIRSFPG